MPGKLIACICLTVVIIVALIVGGISIHTGQFVNNGYCEGALPGLSGYAWVKCAK